MVLSVTTGRLLTNSPQSRLGEGGSDNTVTVPKKAPESSGCFSQGRGMKVEKGESTLKVGMPKDNQQLLSESHVPEVTSGVNPI